MKTFCIWFIIYLAAFAATRPIKSDPFLAVPIAWLCVTMGLLGVRLVDWLDELEVCRDKRTSRKDDDDPYYCDGYRECDCSFCKP